MKFHHLVEINDPLQPLLEPLSAAQVWRGLMLRARDPVPFVYELEQCIILSESDHSLHRQLQFSGVTIEDEVHFEPPHRIRTVTRAQPGLPSATLIMSIEEPRPGQLAVRFDYDTGTATSGDAMENFYDSFRRSAYMEADIDTIGHIRALAREGRL